MVQRSKRSLSLGKIEEMQRDVRAFEWKVRGWAAEVPHGSADYLGLDPLNHSRGLMTHILNRVKDGGDFERRYGEGGSE